MIARADSPPSPLVRDGLPLALLAVMVPTLLAADDPPLITFYNQVLGVFGWGVWMTWLARCHPPEGRSGAPTALQGPIWGMSAVLWICAAAALASVAFRGLPAGLGLMAATLALSAWWVMRSAWWGSNRLGSDDVTEVFALALAWTGLVAWTVSAIQVFMPEWTDGMLLAEPTVPGRAVGNLRQPNHLSTLLVFAICGVAWLGRRQRWPSWLAAGVIALFIGGVVWSASRTGMVGMALLSLWGLRDNRMPLAVRAALLGAPVLYLGWWQGMAWWAQMGSGHAFAAEARLHDGSDISSSRFAIWSNTLELVRMHPWTGVGWGNFNLAWTFTPFPDRPVAFFDHTHNVILQWAVELGVPLTVLLTALCGWGLWSLWWPWRCPAPRSGQPDAQGQLGLAATLVSMAAFHSLVEYPLWYSYFLLPTAFALGLGLSAGHGLRRLGQPFVAFGPASDRSRWVGTAMGVVMAAGAAWCAIDYQWAANIYAPRPGAGPLDARIEAGQQRLWFGYQADYAHVTQPDDDEPSVAPAGFARTVHNLVDARLMMAYARSLAEHGRVDHARYVAQRLREFRHRSARDYFAPCAQAAPGAARPYQCEAPQGRYTWVDVLP